MLILASKSPRRKEILTMLGFEFDCRPSETDETILPGTHPAEAVEILAERKAKAVVCETGDTVIGSDTVVALDDVILGKPKDEEDAKNMLRALSNRTHTVHTGVCILQGEKKTVFSTASKVKFYPLSDSEIEEYIATKEPMDKAGAYGIQGKGLVNIEKIDGDFYSIMGLPAAKLTRELKKFGIEAKN